MYLSMTFFNNSIKKRKKKKKTRRKLVVYKYFILFVELSFVYAENERFYVYAKKAIAIRKETKRIDL